jgi:hypothetical protein
MAKNFIEKMTQKLPKNDTNFHRKNDTQSDKKWPEFSSKK